MTIEHLKLAIGRPRESILRDLKSIGYFSSYNARGKYYTLSETPEFDELGIWKYQNAYFSIKRTLLDTAEHLVNISDAGLTHDELRRMLGIDLQNSLYQLIATDKIIRRQINTHYVYFSKRIIESQIEKRNAILAEPAENEPITPPNTRKHPDIPLVLIIDILVAVLRGHDTNSAVHSYLKRTGSSVTEQQVMTVFLHYSIGKKNFLDQN
jgi:hypothetical protein